MQVTYFPVSKFESVRPQGHKHQLTATSNSIIVIDIYFLSHFSPSGCTFWGKKPWSRKKKILWQLGTLVGAPVGITLLAGIAVPAMIIGIPVWVGRKVTDLCLFVSFSHDRRSTG